MRKTKVMPKGNTTKLFVLDTNVLIHDPSSIFRFEEHDIFIPMMTLEELDKNKTGLTEVARSSRQVTRTLDQIVSHHQGGLTEGIALDVPSSGMATGTLYFQSEAMEYALPMLANGKADNQILSVVVKLKEKYPQRHVILVSKDINIRIKARSLKLEAEDYRNDLSIEDSDLLPTGLVEVSGFWHAHGKDLKVTQKDKQALYTFSGPRVKELEIGNFLYMTDDDTLYRVVAKAGKKASMLSVTDYRDPKHAVCGIVAKNVEQAAALDLLMDPEIDLVSLLGQAGTGKTLMTLAAAIAQTHKSGRYNEILATRATVALGKEIGFLPGDEAEKMQPWMGAIDDNLEVIGRSFPELSKPNSAGQITSKIKVKSMSFMRGRTFIDRFIIIDEAQNMTPKEITALITRAGPHTKVVLLGNNKQIDTPYLTEGGSGLTYAVERFRGWQHAGSLILKDCVRSRLADYAASVL